MLCYKKVSQVSMISTIEQIEQMQRDAEQRRTAAREGGKSYVSNSIVLLADGQRALVRPLYNMDGVIVVPMHDKFKNTDVSLSSRTDVSGRTIAAPISAVCASEFGKPCMLCSNAKENKLEARNECFIPVYLFAIKDASGDSVTFTSPEGEAKPVKGFRMLRCKQGSPILSQLMSVFKDADYGRDITGCDFLISRKGSQLDTTYSCTPKPPKPMEANLKAAIPPITRFHEILSEIYPIKVLERPPVNGAPAVAKPATPPVAAPEEEAPFF